MLSIQAVINKWITKSKWLNQQKMPVWSVATRGYYELDCTVAWLPIFLSQVSTRRYVTVEACERKMLAALSNLGKSGKFPTTFYRLRFASASAILLTSDWLTLNIPLLLTQKRQLERLHLPVTLTESGWTHWSGTQGIAGFPNRSRVKNFAVLRDIPRHNWRLTVWYFLVLRDFRKGGA